MNEMIDRQRHCMQQKVSKHPLTRYQLYSLQNLTGAFEAAIYSLHKLLSN